MVIQGHKKRVLSDVIRYYVGTTGSVYEDLILSVQKTRGKVSADLSDADWLAGKCFSLLAASGITLADCIENKDVIRAAIMEDASRKDGEFYTPEVWCVEGRNYLQKALGDLWGKVYIWDASCGTGNLLKTANYPAEKVFMSTLLAEDIPMVEKTLPGVHAFQCDFVNDMDVDQYNKNFSKKLPKELIRVLENNEPILFYMNPPYKVMESSCSDVGAHMAALGMAKCGLDIFHQFMYRICMLKRFYNLTNVHLGIFGPITMFHSKMTEELYNEFKQEFVFEDGMCFTAGDFSSTSESVGWVVGYTVWRTNTGGEAAKSVLLDAKSADAEGNVTIIGKRLITNVAENLHNWVAPKDVLRFELAPCVTSIFAFTGLVVKTASNALGSVMSSNYVIRATRRAAVTSVPNTSGVDITEENFWRCVSSFGARRAYAVKQNPYNNCQYYSSPDTSIEGYDKWLVDALVLFLFDYSAQIASYRGVDVAGKSWDISNRLFPISGDIARSVISDVVLLEDFDNFQPQNQFLVGVLGQVQNSFSPEARELYEFALEVILTSLQGSVRKDLGYAQHTNAWDAGLAQVRLLTGFFTPQHEEKYLYLVSRLKDKLLEGVYKYGFMMDSAFGVSSSDEEEEEV